MMLFFNLMSLSSGLKNLYNMGRAVLSRGTAQSDSKGAAVLPMFPIYGSETREIASDEPIYSYYTSQIVHRGPLGEGLICDSPEDTPHHGLPYSLLLYNVTNKKFLAAAHMASVDIELSKAKNVTVPINKALRFKTCVFPYPPFYSHTFEFTGPSKPNLTVLKEGRDCPFFNVHTGEGGSRTIINNVVFKQLGTYQLLVKKTQGIPYETSCMIQVTDAEKTDPSHWLVSSN